MTTPTLTPTADRFQRLPSEVRHMAEVAAELLADPHTRFTDAYGGTDPTEGFSGGAYLQGPGRFLNVGTATNRYDARRFAVALAQRGFEVHLGVDARTDRTRISFSEGVGEPGTLQTVVLTIESFAVVDA